MAPGLDDLLCPACGTYAHPFLEACPACGAGRESRYADAVASPDVGYERLLQSPRLADQVRVVVRRYSLRRDEMPPDTLVRDGLLAVGDALAYRLRTAGPRPSSSERAHLELDEDALVLCERNPWVEIVRVPLDAILSISHAAPGGHRAGSWSGLAFDGRVEEAAPPAIDGDLVIAHAGTAGLERLALSNRRGIFAARARADHYVIVARWLGVIAAAAAEARWTVVGPRRHAAQLRLAAMPDDGVEAAPSWPVPGSTAADTAALAGAAGLPAAGLPAAAAPVRDALEALEALRTAKLITDDEYAAKRREVLARL